MAVRIRLRRAGGKKEPFYHIIAAEGTMPRDGRFIEKIGFYDPKTEPPTVKLDDALLQKWRSRGALPTPAVEKIIKRVPKTA